MSVIHTVSTSVTTAPKDWQAVVLPLIIQLIPGLLSACVAVLALFVTLTQGRRTLEINEEQAKIATRKVDADLFDKRFGAWKAASDAAEVLYKTILNMRDVDAVTGEMWSDLRKAGETVSFVFSERVVMEFKGLDDALTALLMTKIDTLADPTQAPHRPNYILCSQIRVVRLQPACPS